MKRGKTVAALTLTILAVGVGAWLAGTAFGQQKPGAAAPQFNSGAEIKAHFERLYLQALNEYVARKPTPADVEDAYSEMLSLAVRNDWYAEARPQAEGYLKNYPDGRMSAMAQLIVAMDELDKDKSGQAKEAFQAMIKSLGSRGIEMGLMVADRAVATGKVELAKELLEQLSKEFSDEKRLQEAIKNQLASLEKIGTEPPRIGASDLSGKRINLADYKGKVTLVDFWATWCGPCVKELPNVRRAYEKYHAKGFEVIGISLDNEKSALEDFLKTNPIPWPLILNSDATEGDIAARYGVEAIPATFLIGKDGKIARVHLRGDNLSRAVQALLSGQE